MDKWNEFEEANFSKWNRLSVIKDTYENLLTLSNAVLKKGLLVYDTTSKELLVNVGDDVDVNFESVYEKVGNIEMYTGDISEANSNWMLCDGRELVKLDYKSLYDKIGNTFGETNSTFNLPDYRNAFAIGRNDVGVKGGENSVVLNVSQLPAHSHSYDQGAFGNDEYIDFNISGSSFANSKITGSTRTAGGNQPHENRPPFIKVNYIIKVR